MLATLKVRRVPIKMWAPPAEVESAALDQLRRIASQTAGVECRKDAAGASGGPVDRPGGHQPGLRSGQLVTDLAQKIRQSYVERLADRSKQLRACLLLPALDLRQVAEGHSSGRRHLAQRSVLLVAPAAKGVPEQAT